MDIPSLIQLLQNKVNILSNAKSLAFSSGDMDRMNAIDNDLLSTQNTLSQLQILLAATQAANAASMDLSSVVTAGVEAAQNTVSIPDNPTAVLSDYDISTYAADPLYVQKITDMLTTMPAMDTATDIDTYINNEVVGSPLTGAMIIAATSLYGVDVRLTMAIMELDSRFGTAGVGAQTLNPGNVGNTGTSTQTYSSWPDGIAAVASWLNNHRINPVATVNQITPQPASTTASTAATSTAATTATDTATTPTTNNSTNTNPTTPSTSSTTNTNPTTPSTSSNTNNTTNPSSNIAPAADTSNVATSTATTSSATTTPSSTTATSTAATTTPSIVDPNSDSSTTTAPSLDTGTGTSTSRTWSRRRRLQVNQDNATTTSATTTDATTSVSVDPTASTSTPNVTSTPTTTPTIDTSVLDSSTIDPSTDTITSTTTNATSTQAIRKLRVNRERA